MFCSNLFISLASFKENCPFNFCSIWNSRKWQLVPTELAIKIKSLQHLGFYSKTLVIRDTILSRTIKIIVLRKSFGISTHSSQSSSARRHLNGKSRKHSSGYQRAMENGSFSRAAGRCLLLRCTIIALKSFGLGHGDNYMDDEEAAKTVIAEPPTRKARLVFGMPSLVFSYFGCFKTSRVEQRNFIKTSLGIKNFSPKSSPTCWATYIRTRLLITLFTNKVCLVWFGKKCRIFTLRVTILKVSILTFYSNDGTAAPHFFNA